MHPLIPFLIQAGLLALLCWLPGGRATPFPALLLWAGVFSAYLIAARLHAADPLGRRAVWGGGIALRAIALPLLPHFSDDIYRYLWDGWVQTNGLNPYRFAPADPGVSELATSWSGLINNPDIPTIYPPGAQIAFFALATIAPAIPVFKLAFIAADLGIAWAIDRWAGRRASGNGVGASSALLLYLWSPLLIVEVAWSGHMDPIGILPMVAAAAIVSAAAGATSQGSGLLLGLGAAVKFAPAAAIPALARRHGKYALLGLAVPILLYLPYAGHGVRLFEGLGSYAERWQFNAGPYLLFDASLPGGWPPRLAAGACVAAIVLQATRRRWPLDRALFWIIGAALLVSPTLHPWYALWILPFAAMSGHAGWLAFTGTVFLAYWGRDAFHATGSWPEPAWLRILIWGPLCALLLRDGLRAQRFARGRQVADGEEAGEEHGRVRPGEG